MSDSKVNKFVKKFKEEPLKKRAPKGVDPSKHERCVKEVKKQGKDIGAAHAICTASMKKSENTAIAFKNSQVMVDAKLQQISEETAPKELIQYIKAGCVAEISKIPFEKGILTLSQKEPGLYSGFFQNKDGQIIEQFDNMTPEIVAKNMQVKNLYSNPDIASVQEAVTAEDPSFTVTKEDIQDLAMQVHNRLNEVHDRISQLQQNDKSKHIKIRYGDFELEIKKSLHQFIDSFKKSNKMTKSDIKSGIKAWRRNSNIKFDSDFEAAKHLSANWEDLSEGFFQTLYAEKKKYED